jgi:acylglycerol lipase
MPRLTAAALLFATLAAACAPPFVAARPPATPTSADPRHDEGIFRGAGFVQLYEQAWHPAAAARAAVVIVHGLKDHSARYAALAARLTQLGFAVYAFDLRGHGRSSGIRVFVHKFDEYLDDLAIFLARVAVREPGRPVFLFGHSMGGAIVTLYALTRAPALAGLVLSAPALRVDVSGFKRAATRAVAALKPDAAVFQLDLAQFSRDERVVAECRADPLVYQPPGTAATAAGLLAAMATIDARGRELAIPLLALHGTADRVTDPAGSRALVEHAGSRDKLLKLYDGYFHDLLHEPGGDRVADDLARWLDERAPR